MINSLSQELDVMRPRLLETSLEVVAHNLNHKNGSLRLFEFGKTYRYSGGTEYQETPKLALILTGEWQEGGWSQPARKMDLFTLKSQVWVLFQWLGLEDVTEIYPDTEPQWMDPIEWQHRGTRLALGGQVTAEKMDRFGIKQPVFYAELDWQLIMDRVLQTRTKIHVLPKFPAVQRDLAMVVDRTLPWSMLESTVQQIGLENLQGIKLFDIFESDKLGVDKRSMAINLIFQHSEKTLTDAEIDGWMQQVMKALASECNAEIRK
jgi:phenylalanyl-tRNA synthetase beta chain